MEGVSSFDSLENHPALDNDAQIVVSGVEPLPQQQAIEIESSGRVPTAVGVQEEEQQKDSSTAVDKQEEEQQEDNSTAVMAAALKKAQAFEDSIRELITPQGTHGPDPQKLVEVIAGTIERRTEAKKDLRLIRQRKEELSAVWTMEH